MDYRQACEDIVRRRKADDPVDCSACHRGFSGFADLWSHLEADHGIVDLPSCDNLADAAAFLQLLPRLCNRELTVESDTLRHCFMLASPDDIDESDNEGGDGNGEAQAAFAAGDDDEFDAGFQIQCLFCSSTTTDVEGHMTTAHGFDLRQSAVFDRAVCNDEYARMRMVNAVRRAVAAGKCPACSASPESEEALAQHVRDEKHYLPAQVEEGDHMLVPHIRGDLFMTLLMADDDEDEASAYPMVPTAGDVIRQQARQELEHADASE